MQKKFMLALAIAALGSGSLTALGTPNDASAALRRAFAGVAENVTKSAEMVPADKWNYTPIASVRTFAQQVAHIADSHNYYCAQVSGSGGQWSDPVEKGALDKATLMQKLRT